ncbi:hypothetical protein A2Z41_01595 [Microgenomates group bacterium RBG_19FT_COMBO_39_10]|nr:MAG: hypothetical protein A2Z41_01595 [Microgenomates group bacterium RBG_19FT_COMBO_39_10]
MAIIRKKTWPHYFELIKSGKKKFDLRVADFKVKKGDTLVLEEWDPKTKQYTGRQVKKKINFFLRFSLDEFGQQKEIKKHGFYVIQLED